MAEGSEHNYQAQTSYYQQLGEQSLEQLEAQAPVEWQVGDVILDLYEITALLGEGGMGKVFRTHHRGWNIDLAVKCPKPELFGSQAGKDLYFREAQTWIELGLHPHITSCYYVRTLGGAPRLFAECVEGGSLESWIESRRLYEGGKEKALARILDIAIQFAWGLAYAHEQGLVHQDVKPGNVLMTRDGTVKVTDFGLANAVGKGGTPAYCSPEQAARQALTLKTDIWSWGVSVLEMFTGEVTWLSGTAAAEVLTMHLESKREDNLIPWLPPALATMLQQCFQINPRQRPKDMTEIASKLQQNYTRETGRSYSRPAPQAVDMQADSLNNKALSLMDLGHGEAARAMWHTCLQANPSHLETIYNLGLSNWRLGVQDDADLLCALQTAEVPAASMPAEDWRRGWLVSQVHLERGDVVQAQAVLASLPAQADSNPEVAALQQQAAALQGTGHRLSRTFDGHTDRVTSVCLSRDMLYALSAGEDGTVLLWRPATGACLGRFAGHAARVTSLALSVDGRFALSGSWDDALKLWEFPGGRCLHTFEGHKRGVDCVCLSADGRYALSGSGDKTLKLWDVSSGECLHTLQGHASAVTCVCMSPDGSYALSGSADKSLMLWDLATGECLRTMEGHEGMLRSVCMTGDGRFAITGSSDKSLKLWDLANGICLHTYTGHTGWVNSVCLSPDEQSILSGSADGEWMISTGSLKLWDLATGECLRTFSGHEDWVTSVSLSADGCFALSGSNDTTLRLWDVSDGQCLRIFSGLTDWVNAVCLSQDERFALTGGDDQRLRLWDLKTGECLRIFSGHTGGVNSVCLSADMRYALSGGGDSDSRSRIIRRAMDRAHGSSRWGGGISIRQDKIVRLWDVAAGTCLRSFEGHTDSVNSVCLSPDGHYALTGSKDQTIRLWDVESGRCLRTLTGHTEEIFAVGFSQDGRYALSNSLDNTFRLWELESGECLRTLQAAGMNIVYLSPGELELLLQSGQDTLQVWDSSPSACLRMFSMKTGELVAACYSEDARYTITWADQGYDFKLWDTHTGLCLRTFEGTASRNVQAVCMSRDGRTALSGAYASLKMWDLQPGYQCPAPFAVARIVTSEMGISVSDLLAEAHTARQRGELSTEVDILRRARSMPGYEHNPEVRDAWSRLYVRTRRTALRSGWLVRTFDSHTGFVNCVCLSADSRYAFSGSRDNTIKQWEVATGQCLRTFTGHKHNVTCVSLSADENHLLSGSEDSTLRLWEVATGKCLRTITGITGFVNSIALSADGRYALTGSGDGLYSSTGKLQLWELATGRCLRTFEGQTPWVNSLCLSGDERYALSGGKDGTPKLWKVSRGKGVKKYSGHSASVNAVCLSKDGRYLLSGSNDSSLKLWDLATMKCLRTFPGHIVDAACLSADDRYALTGGYDGTLKIWDLATGECLSTLVGHTHSVSAVSLSADGRYALSGSWDQTLKLWELDWELEAMEPADWDEGAQPLLENFLTLHTPYGNPLPRDRMPSAEEFNLAFTRAGQPTWQEQDFQQLLTRLGCAGYGWLRPEGVRRELDRMAGDHGAAAPPLKPATPAPVPPDLPAPGDKRTWLSRLLGKDKK